MLYMKYWLHDGESMGAMFITGVDHSVFGCRRCCAGRGCAGGGTGLNIGGGPGAGAAEAGMRMGGIIRVERGGERERDRERRRRSSGR